MKQTAFFITTVAKESTKTLAAFAGVPIGKFVNTLILEFGPQCAAVMKERAQHAAAAAKSDLGTDDPSGLPGAGT